MGVMMGVMMGVIKGPIKGGITGGMNYPKPLCIKGFCSKKGGIARLLLFLSNEKAERPILHNKNEGIQTDAFNVYSQMWCVRIHYFVYNLFPVLS